MKRILLATALCLCFAVFGAAQQTASDTPATREDIQKYLEVMHSREMMTQVVDAMSKPMHKMMHEQYLKNQDSLPPDFEARMNKMMDDTMKSFPWDEMLQSMVPVYQKHFTKGDVSALTAFYSTPTGQKVLRELPAITSEAMQSMMPLLQKHMEAMKDRMQQEVAQMIKDSKSPVGKKSQATPN
jgi:hypothetical protein